MNIQTKIIELEEDLQYKYLARDISREVIKTMPSCDEYWIYVTGPSISDLVILDKKGKNRKYTNEEWAWFFNNHLLNNKNSHN